MYKFFSRVNNFKTTINTILINKLMKKNLIYLGDEKFSFGFHRWWFRLWSSLYY